MIDINSENFLRIVNNCMKSEMFPKKIQSVLVNINKLDSMTLPKKFPWGKSIAYHLIAAKNF